MIIILRLFFCLAILIFINFNCYSNFEIKMSDSISPFFSVDKDINHYSNIPFYQLDLYNEEELVDKIQLEESKERFKKYIVLLKDNWYNSISLDDLNHLVLFEKSWIYTNTEIERRNKIYQNYYKELINIANDNKIDVYITTDMQFYTDLLEKYVWKLSSDNKELLRLNKEAFDEIFTNLQWISWVIMRIWEGWKAYNSGNYKSKILYKTPEDINYLLKQLLPIFEKNNKLLIFRTWTIWVWKVGDLIYNGDTYDKTFYWINSDNLVVSIKHTPWDFFWFENINPTIWYGKLKQIVEIQVRREYEWWWDFPNYMWGFYKDLVDKIKDKKNVIWVWNWNQTWWWWWWKNVLFNYWFNFWNEINFYSVWNILNNKDIDLIEILNKYDFNSDEKKVLIEILLNSRQEIKKWWYINDFRKKEIKIWSIYLPPLSRIWWDKITSSPIILSITYNSLDDKIKTIEESSYILWIQKQEISIWKNLARNNKLNNEIYNSLLNRYKIFEITHIFKKAFIEYFQTWNKKYYYELNKKILEYKDFVKDKNYFNFNYDEIYKFYSIKTNNIFLFINLFSFLMPFVIIYFVIINIVIKKFNWFELKLKWNIKKIIYFFSPVSFWLLFIVVVSYIFWEQYFWIFLSLGIIENNFRILIILITISYFLIIIYFTSHFSNITKYIEKIHHKRLVNIISIIFLAIFLLIILSLDNKNYFISNLLENILPSYFQTAWTDVNEYF